MKRTALILTALALRGLASAAPFQNLGFEEARTNSLVPDPRVFGAVHGPISDILPGWQLSLGNQPITSIGLNYPLFIIPNVETIVDANGVFAGSLEGRYTLRLNRSPAVDTGHYTLTQTADIPPEAQFLSFTYRQLPFVASINGENVTPEFFLSQPLGTVTGDISKFAGQTVTLAFRTTDRLPGLPDFGLHELDAIAFTVPEPSTLLLITVGISALAWWRTRRRYE